MRGTHCSLRECYYSRMVVDLNLLRAMANWGIFHRAWLKDKHGIENKYSQSPWLGSSRLPLLFLIWRSTLADQILVT